ncbi:hypothetical protein [Helicobacter suis]|uniref:hypothetical protein n=1 Tax=Helicobacter suis TaxID=104628 RepID=UPI0013D1E794|nr:hypothetical protein [Helicobacter suis]
MLVWYLGVIVAPITQILIDTIRHIQKLINLPNKPKPKKHPYTLKPFLNHKHSNIENLSHPPKAGVGDVQKSISLKIENEYR